MIMSIAEIQTKMEGHRRKGTQNAIYDCPPAAERHQAVANSRDDNDNVNKTDVSVNSGEEMDVCAVLHHITSKTLKAEGDLGKGGVITELEKLLDTERHPLIQQHLMHHIHNAKSAIADASKIRSAMTASRTLKCKNTEATMGCLMRMMNKRHPVTFMRY